LVVTALEEVVHFLVQNYRRMSAVLVGGAVIASIASQPQAVAANKPQKVSVEVKVGWPYRAAVGERISLTASVSVGGQSKTTSDLRRIGQALKEYRDANGSFPPAAISDGSGKPLLSWRVLLLPYLSEQALYKQFDLSKAWDDPTNRALLAKMPTVFKSATQRKGSTTTAYAGVGGVKQLFRGSAQQPSGGVRAGNVVDGADMTIAVGPVGSGVKLPWSAPGDLDIVEHSTLGSPSGFDGAGALVTPMLFLDGTVRPLLDDTPAETVESWSTIAGGGCAPPWSLELKLQPAWDLDGDGEFETLSLSPVFTAENSGNRTLRVRVVDSFGGVHTSSARLSVR
jgi:Protein of unknown function (DUF1559)